MRTIIAAAVALFLGLIIGSLGPREDLREAEARIAELQQQLAKKPKRSPRLSQLLDLSRSTGRVVVDQEEEAEAPVVPKPSVEASAEEPSGQADDAGADSDSDRRPDLSDIPPEQLDKARTAMEMRRAQARAALLERVDLEDEQLDDFDDAVAQMNEGLQDIAAELAYYVDEGREPTRREAMHLAADVLDVVLEADDTISEVMTEEQYETAGEEAVDPLSYIDPSIVDLFQEL